jgi:two-component system sensor histidine kinase ChvG
MRLRKQLFLLSLITLSLPWVGCQYIRELEHSLHQGQSSALDATALAVAAKLSSDEAAQEVFQSAALSGFGIALYQHSLKFEPVIDGYADDWHNIDAQALNSSVPAQGAISKIRVAQFESQSYILLNAADPQIIYERPDQSDAAVDRILLRLQDAAGKLREFSVKAGGPGKVACYIAGTNTREHRIFGHWLERGAGYQLELSLPAQWSIGGLAIEQVDINSNGIQRWSNQARSSDIPILLQHSHSLSRDLSIFAREGVRLKLASRESARLASAGQLSNAKVETNWIYNLAYRLLPSDEQLPMLADETQSGFFQDEQIQLALEGVRSSQRFQTRRQELSRSAAPIYSASGDTIVGAVIAEQNADTLSSFTSSAFSRLMLYSFVVSCAAALLLVLYASWLSLRIGLLNRATSNAISDSGMISEQFKASKQPDEIGELSRSFAMLLSRLKEYTNYLRTLSSKLSHELRTPLAIVSSSLDNLEHEKLSKQARVFAERAKEGTSRLSNILNAMSAASRVEQAIGAAELEQIPLDEMLASLKEAYGDVYKHVRFELKTQPHKQGFKVLGAGELLVQMLDKLVDNAADFCPQNGLIEFGLYRREHEIVITVRNEGPPLPQTMHKQLFDSMVSVRESDAMQEKGHHLGLGLYIVRLIVDFHQGKVNAYNVPDNSGAIFEIRLPTQS